MSMNNLYIETATELVSVFTLLNEAVANAVVSQEYQRQYVVENNAENGQNGENDTNTTNTTDNN